MEAESVNHGLLRKFQKERPKPRAVLVTLPSATAIKHVIAKNMDWRPEWKDMNVFVSRDLSIEDYLKENICPKSRKELIEQGVKKAKLKKKNFKLYNDAIEVPLNDTPNNQTNTWLSHLHIQQFNSRSLVDCQRPFKTTKIINFDSYNVICICETWLNSGIPDSGLLLNDYTIYRTDKTP